MAGGQERESPGELKAEVSYYNTFRQSARRIKKGTLAIALSLTACGVEEGVVNVPSNQLVISEFEAAQVPYVSLAKLDNPIVADSLIGKPVRTEAHLKLLRRDVEWRSFFGLPVPSVFKYDKSTIKQIELLTYEATDGKDSIHAVIKREYGGLGYMGFKEHKAIAPNPEDTYTLVGNLTEGDVQLPDKKTVHGVYLQVDKILQK